jgi:DNA-binding transcriptional regulator YhcF (GntR family)
MRLWFSRDSEVSLRDQLVTQFVLCILGGELAPGQRLPSTRELARRFHLHSNTVSSGYRQLERDNWVEFRKGSGIYVREHKPATSSPTIALDQLIARIFQSARELNVPLAVVRSRLRQWLELQPPDHFVLVEPDVELAHILLIELQKALTFPVESRSPEECRSKFVFEGAIVVALSMTAKAVRRQLLDNAELLELNLRSVGESLAPYLPAPTGALVGIASRWPPFLKNARTMLVAAGFHPDSLIVRDATQPNWRRGLKQAAAVICDSLISEELEDIRRVLPFPLLAESSLKQLRDYENFISSPLAL